MSIHKDIIAESAVKFKNLVRKWRRKSEDFGPIPARVYLDCAAELEAVIKETAKQTASVEVDSESTKLPQGKTCADCHNFKCCEYLISCKPTNTECDWMPSRFALPHLAATEGAKGDES